MYLLQGRYLQNQVIDYVKLRKLELTRLCSNTNIPIQSICRYYDALVSDRV